jgi:hypothetical protein
MTTSGGIISTGNMARQLEAGINAVTNTSYKDYVPEYTKILQVVKSTKNYETDTPQAALGLAPVKAQGDGIEYDATQEGNSKRYYNVVYSLGAIITMEAIEDNLYMNQMDFIGNALKRSLVHTEEQVAANVFNNGYDTNFTGWDAKPLFASDHQQIKGGTMSNVLPIPADLSEASLEDALIAVENFRDDAGLLIDARVDTLHIPRELRFIACRILASPLQNDTGNNAINAIQNEGLIKGGYHVNHRFTDPKNWFLRTDVSDGGKFFRRSEHRFETDNDFGTSDYRHKGMTRFSVGWTDFRQYFGSGQVA